MVRCLIWLWHVPANDFLRSFSLSQGVNSKASSKQSGHPRDKAANGIDKSKFLPSDREMCCYFNMHPHSNLPNSVRKWGNDSYWEIPWLRSICSDCWMIAVLQFPTLTRLPIATRYRLRCWRRFSALHFQRNFSVNITSEWWCDVCKSMSLFIQQ